MSLLLRLAMDDRRVGRIRRFVKPPPVKQEPPSPSCLTYREFSRWCWTRVGESLTLFGIPLADQVRAFGGGVPCLRSNERCSVPRTRRGWST